MAAPKTLGNLDDEFSFLRPYLEDEEEPQKEEEQLPEEFSFLSPYMERPKAEEPVEPQEIPEEYSFLQPYMEQQKAPTRPTSLVRAEAPTLESLGITLPQPPPPEEGLLRQAADLPVQFAIGVNNTIKGLTDLFGADNAVSQNLNQNVDWYRSLLSASAKADEEEVGRILQEAEGAGMLEQLAIGLKAFSVAPLDFVASGAGSLAVFAGTAALGKIAGLGKVGLTAVQAATGAGMGAGIVKGEIYSAVKDEMMGRGLSEEEAKTIAMEAQSYGGKNLDQILLGAGLSALSSATGANAIISRALTKAGREPSQSLIKSVLKNGLVEGVTETAQATQEKVAANLALIREGVEGVTPFQGAVAQGALEGAVGVALGAGGAVLEPRVVKPENVAAAASDTKSVAQQNRDIAPATADIVSKQAEQVIEQVGGEAISIPATVTPRREGETDAEWRARTERERAETPDERVARLQREAQEAAGDIELEEDVAGLPPQPVTPTPEAPPVEPVAPVEPVVPEGGARPPVTPEVVPKAENAVVEAEQKSEQESDTVKVFRGVAEAGALPTGGAFFTDSERDASAYAQLAALRKAIDDNPEIDDIVGEVMSEQGAEDLTDLSIQTVKDIIEGNNIKVGDISEGAVLRGNIRLGNVLNLESFGSEVGKLSETWNQLNELGLVPETWQSLDEDVQAELQDKYRGKAFYYLLEGEVNLNDQFAKGIDTIVFTDQNTEGKGTHRTYLTKAAEQFAQEAAPAAVGPTPVAPPPVTPQLEPLRRVARAEQTEEDVAGLVDSGFVEVYNGQPVITQAGLEALPEAERPRLTPEARKIQIDTRTSEAVAEAISKNLRIGVDQVPADVRMPAGWTLVGDVYVPPTRMAKIETFDVEALAEVDEDSDVFADVIKRKDEAKAAVVQKPEGSAFATQDEFRAAFDLRGEGHGRFATRLDLMVADGVITSDGRDLIMAVIYDNNTDDVFLNNMEMGSFRNRVTSAYGRGGVSRQTVESAKGKAIGVKPSLRMIRNARRDLDIDARTAQTLSTFWHEFGHAGYYSLLDKAQKDKIASIYRKTTKAQREKFFGEGVAAARQENVTARYYAKSETEWFAQSFAEYVLTKKSDQKGLVPIFESILTKIKGVFGRLFSRKEGAPELEDIFEYIIQGKDYGTTKVWWNGMQMSLSPALYGVGGAQPVDPQFSKRLLEREKQNRAKARRSITAPEAIAEEPAAIGEIPPTAEEPIPVPTFTEGTPEAATLKEMEASMAKVDAASEAKGGKPETQKISDIAANWMDQGGDERALQDAIVENTNLTPANAARVAKAIARQYDIQQSIATAFLETQTGLSVEALPEGVALPKEVDPDRPKPVMQRLFEVFMGVRVPPTKITVNEKTALKQQIRLKAAANRAAKAAQKETSDQVVEVIKAMDLRGGVRPKQVQALAKRAAKVIWTNEKSLETFADYAAKVVENANYDADLREAKAAQARAKQLSKQKKIAMGPQREMLDNISKIAVNRLDDPRMYADVVNYYLRGFKAVLSPDYVVVPDSEMTSYLSQMQSEANRNQRDLDRAVNERLAEKYGVDIDDLNSVLEAADIISQLEANENREAMDNLLTEKAIETRDGLKAYDQTPLRADQRKLVDAIMKVDPKALDAEERQRFIRITNNIIYNNQTNGAEYFASVAKGQQSARAAAQDSDMIAKNKAWINLLPRLVSERMQRGWALELQSVADTFRNAFGKGSMAKIYKAMGMLDLNMGFTKANNTIDEIQEKIAEFHTKLEKKYKAAARNQDGLLAEGVAGFLIQNVPNKGETESIAQRRDLIKQDIANRRRSGEVDRMAMADRIETILNQIDGEGVQAVLNNLKQTYPANHESLVWYKDTLLPQYKEFLKNFDENFNDQANNYDNPDYLPIAFSKASPSLAITKEEEQVFYDQVSLRPKQAANTIKRLDYVEIPRDRTTGAPKEIEFNLRRNAFDSLSDQINKAYTSAAWQQLASFMKTPESEVVFGGQANKDFFIERLNRLRLSRMRRGAMSRGNIERAVDALSVISRKLGTGIALGGVYQWIKQPPDQLVTALGSGGRYDLMAQNIMPKNQKAARELLRKFSIGRRGDASSGYKYINQMEGHQNRLERYFSESKWDQVKEEGSKVADVWMAALKQSDFWAASTAWMTYYEGELNKRDIKIEDWAKEAELVDTDPARQEAAAFAEQMTDIYQGSSDPTQMATFAQSGKSGWENLMKAIFVPFNSFAIQQRMRLYSDARDVLNGEKSGVGGLTGTIGGLLLFHATKRLVLPVISGSVAGILYTLLGVDMEEPDEEKQKEEANKRWRQMQGEMLGNLLVGGTPQIVEAKFIDAMNYASYLISLQLESENILNDEGEVMAFDQYAKERSPFWRYRSFDNAMSLGMLDIGLGQAEQAILQTKMVADPEEMEMYTPEEQRLLYFSTLSEWLYLMRLNDADFARIVSKARRDMMSVAKEREKELKRIREGR